MSRTQGLWLVVAALAAGLAFPALAAGESYNRDNPPNRGQIEGIIGLTFFYQCGNYNNRCKCVCEKECVCNSDKCDWIWACKCTCSERTEDTMSPPETNSAACSLVDNMGFNHISTAWDYSCKDGAPGCSSCGGLTPQNGLPRFDLMRIHRFRDVAYPSSFGPGVYCFYDVRLFLYTLEDGTTLIDLMDPASMNVQKFVDGPYDHPFNPTDPKDGTYISFRTNSHHSLQLLDENGDPATDQADAAEGVLRAWDGRKFIFQIVSIDGQRVGRLARMEDRNGYALNLSYKFDPGDDLGGSESKLLQIDTITDAYGQQATFTYSDQTVGGRWVVTGVAMPNATSVTYSYAGDGYLSGVAYPDGTQSTFTRTYNAASNCTIYSYFDAGAEGIHRAKEVYLTTNFAWNLYLPDDIIPQSASLVRMIVNGAGEICYWNLPCEGDGGWYAWIFEGNGLLKSVNAGVETCFAKNWSLTRADGQSWSVDSVSAPMEWPVDNLCFASWDQPWYRGEAYRRYQADGLVINYTYNSASNVASRTYADATTETFSYNEFQQVTQYKDRDNRVTQYTFDSRGNMLTKKAGMVWQNGEAVETSATATWSWEYYPAENAHQFLLKKAIDANGKETEYAYGEHHLLETITQPPDEPEGDQGVTTFTYDSAGRLSGTEDPVGRVVEFEYDSRCRPSVVTYDTYPDEATEEFTYYTTESGGVNANLLKSKEDRVAYL